MRVSEEELLSRWLPRLNGGPDVVIPPGDDCAAVRMGADTLQLIAVDQVVSGHHYLAEEDPERVGRKLLARNLSDIAAMGGTPTYALITLALPPETSLDRADGIMQGIHRLAQLTNTAIIGGDVCGAPAESATLTILGTVPVGEVVRRNTAQPHDLVFVTGCCGGSFASEHHLDFVPRLAEGRFLAENGFASAMIDTSDGLALDLQRICKASQIGAELELDTIPLRKIDGQASTIEAACFDGEDYELLFTVPLKKAQRLMTDWPFDTPLTQIGHCRHGDPIVSTTDGHPLNLEAKTFRHF